MRTTQISSLRKIQDTSSIAFTKVQSLSSPHERNQQYYLSTSFKYLLLHVIWNLPTKSVWSVETNNTACQCQVPARTQFIATKWWYDVKTINQGLQLDQAFLRFSPGHLLTITRLFEQRNQWSSLSSWKTVHTTCSNIECGLSRLRMKMLLCQRHIHVLMRVQGDGLWEGYCIASVELYSSTPSGANTLLGWRLKMFRAI